MVDETTRRPTKQQAEQVKAIPLKGGKLVRYFSKGEEEERAVLNAYLNDKHNIMEDKEPKKKLFANLNVKPYGHL
ncbi:unnamed protein product, partial [Dovyalis caffra]